MIDAKQAAVVAVVVMTLATLSAASPFGLGVTGRYQAERRARRTATDRDAHTNTHTHTHTNTHTLRGSADDPVGEFPPETFLQIVNHFPPVNGDDGGTWAQRWWYNDTHFAGARAGAPVFLFIEGEGPSHGKWVTQGHMMELAQRYGALAVSLEHRYYGLSYPTPDMPLTNLTLLTSQQALADLDHFSAYIRMRWNLSAPDAAPGPTTNPFVSFGGSYAGALSSWYRLTHPNAVFAAVASSPPVRAVLDFAEYDNVIYRSYHNALVGGSGDCTQWIDWAFANLTQWLTTPARHADAQRMFHTCDNITSVKDTVVFAAGMADNIKGIAQYNMGKMYGLNIESVCAMMLNDSVATALERLQDVFDVIQAGQCMDISYNGMVAYLSNSTKDIDQASRQWTWQTCNEFGYFQDCAVDQSCMFSDLETLSYYTDLCADVYQVSAAQTSARINATNDHYLALQPTSTRVVFVNGLIDPWHALSILTPLSDSLPAVTIADGSHCSDLSASKSSDPQDLHTARVLIDAHVGGWLQDAHTLPDDGSSGGLSTKDKVILGVCVGFGGCLLLIGVVVCCRRRKSDTNADGASFTQM